MARTLGASCKAEEVFLAVAADGALVADAHEKLVLSAGVDENARVDSALRDIKRTLTEVAPDRVRVLLPEQTYKNSYGRIAPRVTLETLIRVACAEQDVPLEMLKRPTARSRLGASRGGNFEQATAQAVGPPVGSYWAAGRNLAAAAALAEESS